MERFDRLGDPLMEALATPRRKLGVRHFADPVVGEAEALADGGADSPPRPSLTGRETPRYVSARPPRDPAGQAPH
jgi:hypothetical protein